MQIPLFKNVPFLDGVYLVKFGVDEKLHLVTLGKNEKGEREILCENGKSLYFNEFPDQAYWSPKLNICMGWEGILTEAEEIQKDALTMSPEQCSEFVAKIHKDIDAALSKN
jgi:hypothetical protein